LFEVVSVEDEKQNKCGNYGGQCKKDKEGGDG